MKVKAGDVITFKGVCWDDGWEFDAPCIVFEPVIRQAEVGSLCRESVLGVVEDICIDLCIDGEVMGLDPKTDKEWKWRRWTVAKIRRKPNVHEVKVRFFEGSDGLEFEFVEENQPAVTG